MRKKKGQGGSPSSSQPRFVLEDGQSVEIASSEEGPRKKRGRPPLNRPKLLTVTLQMRHSINGVFYGPGTVRLSESKAMAFLNTEQAATEKEDSLFQQRAFILGFRNGVPMRREVPAQRFDDIMAREELVITPGGAQ